MKQSIDFLPERKQRDLHELVGLIRDEVKDVVMIILYGSYARNTYVELDIRRDYGGGKIQYMSDYDILVVSKKRLGSRTVTVSSRVKSNFLKNKNANTQTRPSIINESITKFNNALSEGRYFYVDILTEGIVLYNSGECQLATPRDLNFSEILQMAEEYYNGLGVCRSIRRYSFSCSHHFAFVDRKPLISFWAFLDGVLSIRGV